MPVMTSSSTLLVLPEEFEFDQQNVALVERIQAALAHPLSRTFRDCLDRLKRIARNRPGARVKLWMDFAPHSFAFAVVLPDRSAWLNGGVIFHGAHDSGGNGGAPTYSVSITPMDGWTLHT